MAVKAGSTEVLQGEKAGKEYRYPFAAAPDIIRANQKDAYFQAVLLEQISSILRSLRGARFAHSYTTEARALADLIYMGLTTLVGNRTLGEEYCDIIQVQGDTGRLPSLQARSGYIFTTILLPYIASRVLPRIRRLARTSLEAGLSGKTGVGGQAGTSRTAWMKSYLLENLDTITSPAPIYAVSLATFYFSGAYYHISNRLFNLRYIFTHTSTNTEHRAGYEVLGVLLLLQLSVQAYLHLHSKLSPTMPQLANPESMMGTSAVLPGEVEVSLDPNAYSANNALLFSNPTSDAGVATSHRRIAAMTHTPHLAEPRFDLENEATLQWLRGRQARKCTLCLEPIKDPSATTCGHLFCWTCICDWCREKPECPLCRQTCLVQHILPMRE